jgi:predicted DNA-binding transcriptional regulator AlpA
MTEQRAAGPKTSKKRAALSDLVAVDTTADAAAIDTTASDVAEQSATERRKNKPRQPRLSPPLPVYLRYPDLVAAGLVNSWMAVNRLVDAEGFPPGVRLSANVRAWRRDEVEAWLAARPSSKKPVPKELGCGWEDLLK